MAAPTVLVVMPVYNVAAYVGRAAESVLGQTFRDFELLAIDDGSTDGGGAVLETIRDPRLVVNRQANIGLAASLNRGLAYARERGIPFLARMDGDDVSAPNRIEAQLARLDAVPGAAACSCNCHYVDTHDTIIGASTVPLSPRLIAWELRRNLRGMVHGATLFRTDALAAVGGYRESFRHAEDYDLFLRLSESYPLVNRGEFLYRIRLNPASLSLTNAARNSLYCYYALDCARRRARGVAELAFDAFAAEPGLRYRLALRREMIVLRLWRLALAGNKPAALAAAAVDPKRVLARILRLTERWTEPRPRAEAPR